MSMTGRFRAWWHGAGDPSDLMAGWGPAETFAVQRLYERYGRNIYARAAADPAFAEAIAEHVATVRRLQRDEPQAKGLDRGEALNGYLLGYAHALLMQLLDAAVGVETDPAAMARDAASTPVRLGAMFQMAFDGGLLKLPTATDAS